MEAAGSVDVQSTPTSSLENTVERRFPQLPQALRCLSCLGRTKRTVRALARDGAESLLPECLLFLKLGVCLEDQVSDSLLGSCVNNWS